jgi:hypothetical protein
LILVHTGDWRKPASALTNSSAQVNVSLATVNPWLSRIGVKRPRRYLGVP